MEINILDNGPLVVKGQIKLVDAQGNAYDLEGKEAVALCRCGASENKPFCDGKHKAAGFESQCSAG
ncbi:MAG: CDGSH iron-sulfur domain-containing protein [Planctomycetota bacterium]|jgi:CDGSH-type Zn-finger protein